MPMAAPISPFSSERRKSWRPARSVSVGVSGRTSRHISWATNQPAVRNRNCKQTGDYWEQTGDYWEQIIKRRQLVIIMSWLGIIASRRGIIVSRWNIIASRQWIIAIIWKIISRRRVIIISRQVIIERRRVIIVRRQGIIAIISKIIARRRVIIVSWWGIFRADGGQYGLCCASRADGWVWVMGLQRVCRLQAARLLHKLLNQTVQILIINDFRLVQASRLERWPRKMLRFKTCYGSLFLAN